MKNKKNIIYIGIVFIVLGIVLFVTSKPKEEVHIDNNPKLSNDEAKVLVNDMVKKVINVYENPKEVFEVEEEKEEPEVDENGEKLPEGVKIVEKDGIKYHEIIVKDYIVVKDYDSKINALFTEKGINELEKTVFNKKSFVKKEEDKISILIEIPTDNQYINSNISVDKVEVKEEEITATVTLTTYKLSDTDSDELEFYVIVKNIKLVKKNDVWFVDSFPYLNKQ